ncbi:MAG TPA: beta-galactosidase [Kiritimatiellia bacterium]|nr:beta-galactosidase [Kiritimatiellia bacterium]
MKPANKAPLRFPPINGKCPHMIHGADYNPDQWLNYPDVLEEDLRLMQLARVNSASVGIFSWASLEPSDGVFAFDWLDRVMDRLADNGQFAVLATPSGSKPAWMSEAHPEVCRMTEDGHREPHGRRHNHCRTSPVYRAYCARMNTELARRYGKHPALLVWHVSNEYNGGECHCPLCHEAFREWLKKRYHNNLDALNHAWWTGFWSHTFTTWEQIRPLDSSIHGLMLDWKRFLSDQTLDFFRHECAPLREWTPDIPITTNFMGFHITLDYWSFAREVDVVSWDSYPAYHDRPLDWLRAVDVSFVHNMNRSFKQKPFMLMECTPSVQNWQPVNKLKRPGVHLLEAMQAVAHGADTVQYFQWRKSRGGFEKFHGAVVDHCGHEHTRVFREVADVGAALARMDDVTGTTTPAEVAILFDWENRWAIDGISGLSREERRYPETCTAHYRPFWSSGVPCDVINEDCDLSKYKLLITPMLYMVRPGFAERIDAFVRDGGTWVTTYLTGQVDESDLCFLNGFPGPLREILGVWAEETDTLYESDDVQIEAAPGTDCGLQGAYKADVFCDLIHTEGAKVLATYANQFYRGRPALTVHTHGKGRAYYMASRNEPRFHADFYRKLIDDLALRRVLGCELPDGVTAQVRTDGEREFIFVLGFNREPVHLDLGAAAYRDLRTGVEYRGRTTLPAYTALVLESVNSPVTA